MNIRSFKFAESALSPREMVAMLLEDDEPQIDPSDPAEDFVAFIKRRYAAKLKSVKPSTK